MIAKIQKLVQRFFALRIIRYGLVGGIGIPINLLALFVFTHIFGDTGIAGYISIFFAFEVSTTINFILNQTFTYHDQKLEGRSEWVKRALKAQVVSISSQIFAYLIKYGLHFNPYLANIFGIVCGFLFQFFVAKRFVFRETTPPPVTETVAVEQTPVHS
jgi:putative flippase GtrA